ncbi:hypothetical protein [Streptomyces sp. NPDC057682]|uniref:hypothetical protein n=1 Tax=Streptomyces sp. NPDC057682 TaxID=3346210 RepID=UPI0036AFAC89
MTPHTQRAISPYGTTSSTSVSAATVASNIRHTWVDGQYATGVLIMNISHDDWRHGGPWWLIRCLGRYFLAFLVSAPVLALVLPAKDVAGEGEGSTYWQGVGAAILTTWILLAFVGVWTVTVLLAIVGFRSRMEVASFRLLAGFLLFLPLFAIPMLGGFSATLIYLFVHLLFVAVLMPVTPGASTSVLHR